MADKSKSGKLGIVFRAVVGALVEGDGIAALADDSWFRISAVAAAGSQLPFTADPLNRYFKTPDSGNAITPIVGDDVYPITLTKVCKTDVSLSQEKGEIDVTDDCESGYNASITDGFTTISGTLGRFMKFDEETGELSEADDLYMSKFYDKQTDDGAGVYVLVPKDDDDIIIAYLRNSDQIALNDIQEWIIFPAILTGLAGEGPLKGVQNGDLTFTKAQGPATRYQRTTNASETVF